uniref:Uncharacterized protein n=1 Tax=Rhizophora mucronata TaxID=61149 RepID=A0A2P2NJV1_RHIMU
MPGCYHHREPMLCHLMLCAVFPTHTCMDMDMPKAKEQD